MLMLELTCLHIKCCLCMHLRWPSSCKMSDTIVMEPGALQVNLSVPLIVRLEGTNVAKGKEILKTSGMKLIAADDLDDAAKKAVQSIQ